MSERKLRLQPGLRYLVTVPGESGNRTTAGFAYDLRLTRHHELTVDGFILVDCRCDPRPIAHLSRMKPLAH